MVLQIQKALACFQVTPYESYVALAERLNRLVPGEAPKKTLAPTSLSKLQSGGGGASSWAAAGEGRRGKKDAARVNRTHVLLGAALDSGALSAAGVENTGVKLDETLGKRYVAFKDPDRIAWEFYMV